MKMVGEQMKKKVSITLVCLMVMAPLTTVSGIWESPGYGNSYTLSWLEANTNAVTSSEQDIYHLVDDINIANQDTLTIDAGETLYFDEPHYQIEIDGDFFVNGEENNPAHLKGLNGRSPFTNLRWNYNGNNEFLMLNVTIENITCVFEDSEDEVLIMESAAYQAPDDPSEYVWDLPEEVLFQVWMIHREVEHLIDWWLLENGMKPGAPPWVYDTDDDGLPNWFEYAVGLNPTDEDDGLLDFDGDGLPNFHEYALGTNMKKVDSDGDSLSDKWENDNDGWDPLKDDTDGDHLRDDTDNMPGIWNDRKVFIFEVTDFEQLGNITPLFDEVANDLDYRGWDVYLFSDQDYTDTGTDTLRDDVETNFKQYEVDHPNNKYGCTWDKFDAALDSFENRAILVYSDIVMIMI